MEHINNFINFIIGFCIGVALVYIIALASAFVVLNFSFFINMLTLRIALVIGLAFGLIPIMSEK